MTTEEILKIVYLAIKDEPEFPGAPSEEIMQALTSGDKDLIVKALRLSVKLTKISIADRILNRISEST